MLAQVAAQLSSNNVTPTPTSKEVFMLKMMYGSFFTAVFVSILFLPVMHISEEGQNRGWLSTVINTLPWIAIGATIFGLVLLAIMTLKN